MGFTKIRDCVSCFYCRCLFNSASLHIAEHARLQYCAFTGAGSSVAYVLDNDVYYKSELNADPLRITDDGVPGIIYNGVPDWVYEGILFIATIDQRLYLDDCNILLRKNQPLAKFKLK